MAVLSHLDEMKFMYVGYPWLPILCNSSDLLSALGLLCANLVAFFYPSGYRLLSRFWAPNWLWLGL